MPSYIENQIAERRQRLLTVDQERLTLLAEIKAYEDALAHTKEGKSAGVRRSAGLNLSDEWIAILRRLDDFTTFNSGDVELVARGLGFDQTAVNIRSQLSGYTEKGIIRRLGLGKYRVSEATKLALVTTDK